MVAGHLRKQNGYFQMILSYKDSTGKRRTKSISTGLPVKGNQKRAEAMLLETRKNFTPEDAMTDKELPFDKFLDKWLKDHLNLKTLEAETYALYSYNVRMYLTPYFQKKTSRICDLRTTDIESYYNYERTEHHASKVVILQLHEIIKISLDYAVTLGWIEDNPADSINPATNEVSILFTDFMLEWLEMMKQCVEETTMASYTCSVKKRIVPYFLEKRYTLTEIEENPKYIQDYYQSELDKGLSANTVIHRHANIRKALQYAFQIGLIKSNPADRVERPKKNKFVASYYNKEELDTLFKVSKGDPMELAIILAAFYGLRRSEVVGLKWSAIDFERKTITIKYTVIEVNLNDGRGNVLIEKERTKSKTSRRTLPLVKPFEDLLIKMYREQKQNRRLCGDCYCTDYLDFIYVNEIGERIKPGYLTQHFPLLLKKYNLRKIRFHDLRHPYVKHTTKIFSLRLMDFQAQAYPDARRKTRGACQLLRVGQSRSPVRPLCNRKRFSCLPPQSKMSWILYAISMRLSGYTSTRSISSSASSVVSVSASKIALDASLRLSCRACSSCFFFACANTAA